MTRSDIVALLAKEKRVEAIVKRNSGGVLNDDLKDLCQIVYVALLETDEDKIIDLFENKQINFYICRIVWVQLISPRSTYHYVITRLKDFSTFVGSIENMEFDEG